MSAFPAILSVRYSIVLGNCDENCYFDWQIASMVLELCITELEDVATDNSSIHSNFQPVVQESSHPYTDDTNTTGVVKIPGAEGLRVEFDKQSSTERR